MKAYHNKEELKSQVISAMKDDIAEGRLQSGKYWTVNQGCHVGCVLEGFSMRDGVEVEHKSHELYEEFMGVPHDLARLFDGLFESLPNIRRQEFSLEVLDAMRVGATLSDVTTKLKLWLIAGVRKYAQENEPCLKAIDGIIDLLEKEGGETEDRAAAWDAARAAARAAARYAASPEEREAERYAASATAHESAHYAAREAASSAAQAAAHYDVCDIAGAAARAAAWSARAAACDAVRDIARAADRDAAREAASSAARAAARDAQSRKLVEILKSE